MENQELIARCEATAREWMTSPLFDADTQAEVKALIDNPDKTGLIDAFYPRSNSAPAACAASWAPAPTA